MAKVPFSTVVRLPAEDAGLQNSIVRIANCNVGSKPTQFARRTPVVITNTANKKWILRYVMGNGGTVRGLTKTAVALDYDGVCDLGVQYEQSGSLTISNATLHHSMLWLMNSPDLNVKLSMRFAVLGALLGLVSLFITAVTL